MTQIEAFGQFRPFSVGFDSIFDTLQRVSVPQTNYPPYNIVKKGESYFVELAVAGFTKKDINIEVENSSLKISVIAKSEDCLLYTSPSPRDVEESRMPSSA